MDNAAGPGHIPEVRRPAASMLFLTAVMLAAHAPAGEILAARSSFPGKLFPRAGAKGVCPDTPLRITFAAPLELGPSGRIQIVDLTTHEVVEAIDVGAAAATQTIGGLSGYQYRPVIVSGAEVTIHLRNGALAYGRTYAVSADATAFKDTAGGGGPISWRFTTKPAPPPAGARRLTVAADGTADFCTVQGAFDFIPDGNTAPRTIFVRRGTYTEIVFFSNKHAITLLGEDRAESVLTYANNDRFNHAAGNPYAAAGANPSDAVISRGDAIYRRAVFMAHRANDLVVANLTIRNTTPSGGSQAEAIILNGTGRARAVLKDLNLVSTQDTLQINGQAYVSNCTIEGDVDFMWGQGPAFFDGCTCRSVRSKGFYTQVRNPGTNHGFVFVRCTFEGTPGVEDNYLSRIKTARFPDSEVVLIDSVLRASVNPVLWQLQDIPGDGAGGADGGAARVRFWEANSRDDSGRPADVGARLAVSRQLRQPEDAALIASYGSPTFVLGNDWNPRAAPIFAVSASRTSAPSSRDRRASSASARGP
jgi:pectin methylesterase-like acyl-CoA thioesterase